VNAFLRLSNPQIVAKLREKFPEIGEKPDARTVFVKLRELRNKW
jgi:hydroxyacylglutathione hydrolase